MLRKTIAVLLLLSIVSAAQITLTSSGNYRSTAYGGNQYPMVEYNGVTHVVYSTSDYRIMHKSSLDGFSTAHEVASAAETGNYLYSAPKIDVDSNGVLHAVFYKDWDHYWMKSTDNGSTWSAPLEITLPTYYSPHPNIQIGNNDKIHYLHTNKVGTFYHISYRQSTNAAPDWRTDTPTWNSWLQLVNGATTTQSASQPSMIVDSDGTIHVTWIQMDGSSTYDIVGYAKSYDDGATWKKSDNTTYTLPITYSTAENLLAGDSGSPNARFPQITVDNNNKPIITYYLLGAGYDVEIQRYNGTGWERYDVDPLASTNNAENVGLAVDPAGNYHVLAMLIDGTYYDIVYTNSTDQGDTWSTPVTLEDGGTINMKYPSIRLSEDGQTLNGMWQKNVDTTTSITFWNMSAPQPSSDSESPVWGLPSEQLNTIIYAEQVTYGTGYVYNTTSTKNNGVMALGPTYRSFAKFLLNALSSTPNVTAVGFHGVPSICSAGLDMDVYNLTNDPISASYATLWADTIDGTNYVTDANFMDANEGCVASQWREVDLGDDAVTDLEDAIDSPDWFGIGLATNSSGLGLINGWNAGANQPYLLVNYTSWVPSNQVVDYKTSFSYDINATDNIAIDEYFIDDNVNFTINSTTGVITNNTILIPDVYALNISVNDTTGNTLSREITITVEDNENPQWGLAAGSGSENLDPEQVTYGTGYVYNTTQSKNNGLMAVANSGVHRGIAKYPLTPLESYYNVSSVVFYGRPAVCGAGTTVDVYQLVNDQITANFSVLWADAVDGTQYVSGSSAYDTNLGCVTSTYQSMAFTAQAATDIENLYDDPGWFGIALSDDAAALILINGWNSIYQPYLEVNYTFDEILPPANQVIEYNTELSYQVKASDNYLIDQYWIDDTTNFSINSDTGLITNNTLLLYETYWLNISVNDTSGNTNSSLISFTVQNVPPQAPTITSQQITPTYVQVDDDLNCSWVITDLTPSDVLKANVTWFKNGVQNTTWDVNAISCSTGQTCYTTSAPLSIDTARGDDWICHITAYDQIGLTDQENATKSILEEIVVLYTDGTYDDFSFAPIDWGTEGGISQSTFTGSCAVGGSFNITTTANFDAGTNNGTATTTQNGGTTATDELRLKNWRLSVDGNTLGLWHFEEGTGNTSDNAEGTSGADMNINLAGDDVAWAQDASFENDWVMDGCSTDTCELYSTSTTVFPAVNVNTFEGWVKLDTLPSVAGQAGFIFKKRGAYYIMVATDDKFYAKWHNSTNNATGIVTSTTTVTTDVWYHLMVTYNISSGTQLYINGVLENSTAAVDDARSRTDVYLQMMGSQYASGYNYLDGKIKEFRWSNNIRTPSETEHSIYRTSGDWESVNQTMPGGNQLASTTINYTGVDSNNYIDKIEWLIAGVEKANYTTDINSGTSVIINSPTGGSFDDVNDDFTVKVYLVGNGTSTPIISEISGLYVGASSTKYNHYYSFVTNSSKVIDEIWFDGDNYQVTAVTLEQ